MPSELLEGFMARRRIGVIGVLCIAGMASTMRGQEQTAPEGLLPVPDYSGDLWTRSHLTGDWWGHRTRLANKGIQLDVDWTQYVQGIVDGGRDETTRYGGHSDYLIHLDLMRMGLVPGALVTIRGESRYGASVNGEAGPLLPVNSTAFFPLTDELDEDICITVTNLNYTQFLSEHVGLFGGKIDTLDGDSNEFASGRGKSQFMNANLIFNSVVTLRMPYSTLGGGVLLLPAKNIKVSGLILNTTDSSTTTGFDGFGEGASAMLEASFQYRFGDLPGGANVGGLYSFDQDFAQVGGELIFPPGGGVAVTTQDDTWAAYASAWQYVFVEEASDALINTLDGVQDRQGVGVFGRVGIADQDTNPIEWSISGGLAGRGMIPSRDQDVFGVGYYYTNIQTTNITGFLGVDDKAQGFEAFYNFAITPAAHLTLDVQVVENPFPNADTAVILGMRVNLSW
jgi:porin